MTTLTGSFSNALIEGAKAAGIECRGSLAIAADGALTVAGRHSRVWLARGCGALAVMAALLFVATLPVMLEEAIDYDLMDARKGPMLVAMVALVAMVGAWSLVTSVVDRVFGKPFELFIPVDRVRSLSSDDGRVAVVFIDDVGEATYLSFDADAKSKPAALQLENR